MLGRQLLRDGWPKSSWVQVRAACGSYDSQHGLLVEHNGIVDFKDLSLLEWDPQDTWEFAIAAHTGLAVDNHWIDRIVLSTDAGIDYATATVELTLNGQQFTYQKAMLKYAPEAVMTALSPTSGPVLGMTHVAVSGRALAHGLGYSCRFNGTMVPAMFNATSRQVTCFAPPSLEEGTVPFAISLDGVHLAGPPMHFMYYSALASSLAPTGGPVLGGTVVAITGRGLGGTPHAT